MRTPIIVIFVSLIAMVALVVTTVLYKLKTKLYPCVESSMWEDFPESKLVTTSPSDPYAPSASETLVAFDNVLSTAECDYLILQSQEKFVSSKLENGRNSSARTSESTFLKKSGNAWIQSLEQRFATLLQTKPENLEPIQICRYQQGQFYKPHFDADASNKRLSTLLIYLNDLPPDESGGRTIFPKLGAAIRPKKGTGIAWDNLDPDTFVPDEDTLHAGETITQKHSIKYILNVWSLVDPYNPMKNK